MSEFSSSVIQRSRFGVQDQERVKWCRPFGDFVKLNVYITLRGGLCFSVVIARDSSARVVMMFSFKKLLDIVEAAESEAICVALRLTLSAGWSKVMIELDAKSAMEALNSLNYVGLLHWQCTNYVFEILGLKSSFCACNFS